MSFGLPFLLQIVSELVSEITFFSKDIAQILNRQFWLLQAWMGYVKMIGYQNDVFSVRSKSLDEFSLVSDGKTYHSFMYVVIVSSNHVSIILDFNVKCEHVTRS